MGEEGNGTKKDSTLQIARHHHHTHIHTNMKESVLQEESGKIQNRW